VHVGEGVESLAPAFGCGCEHGTSAHVHVGALARAPIQ